MSNIKLCDYGCGQPATHIFKNGKHCCSLRTSACPANVTIRIALRNETMKQIGSDGLSIFQRTNIKNAIARGPDGYKQSAQKQKQTKLLTGINKISHAKTTATRKANNSFVSGGVKARATGISKGIYRDYETLSNFEKYYRQVEKFTIRSWKAHQVIIDPKNLKKDSAHYQLDHIFSRSQGFKNNIPPYIIGHYTNLQMLTVNENNKKKDACWKSKEKLFEDFFSSEKSTPDEISYHCWGVSIHTHNIKHSAVRWICD